VKSPFNPDHQNSFQVSFCRSGQDPIQVSNFEAVATTPRATFQKRIEILESTAVSECMPAAQPATSIPSLLDAYFDYEISLAELMSHLDDGCTDQQLFADPAPKKNQHQNAVFRNRFAELRADFNNRVRLLAGIHKLRWMASGNDADPHEDTAIWCKSYQITNQFQDVQRVDFAISSSNWFGLSKVESVANHASGQHRALNVRIPKAVKTQPCDRNRLSEFEKVMATLVPGSYIARAEKQRCYEFEYSRHPQSPAALSSGSPVSPVIQGAAADNMIQEYWLSEAGICTLEELFQNGVAVEERQTLAFRDLMRHVNTFAH
jgi:hypothetical protein